jgi:hypothetical protein
LKAATFAYNISVCRPLKISPYEFKFKCFPKFAIDEEVIGNEVIKLPGKGLATKLIKFKRI